MKNKIFEERLIIGLIFLIIVISIIPNLNGKIDNFENIIDITEAKEYIQYNNDQMIFVDNYMEVWNRTFGNEGHEWGWSVLQTNDGGYIISGETSSFGNGNYDIFLIKTDLNGNTLWEKTYGGTGFDQGWCVRQTSDEGYIISASSNSFGGDDYDFYVIKTDKFGNEIWSRTYGGNDEDYCHSVYQTMNGFYILIGATRSFGAGDLDIFLLKIDENGNELWAKTYGGSLEDGSGSIIKTVDGGLLIGGYTFSFGSGNGDVWLIKTDSNGNEQWSKTYGGNQMDIGYTIKQTFDGGFVISGISSLSGSNVQAYIIKTDSNGNEQWSNKYGGPNFEEASDIIQTNDNNFIFVGRTNSFGGSDYDNYIVKIDEVGNEIWSVTIGGVEDDWGWNIQKTSDDCYILVGTTYSYGVGRDDIWLLKFKDTENNCPEKPVKPFGPSSGKINIEQTYRSSCIDPDGNQIYYSFDWGDGTDSGWLGPYESGMEIESSHTWTEKGTYEIKVKAKDTNGGESDWSDPLSVTIPKNRALIDIFVSKIFASFNNRIPFLSLFYNDLGKVNI